MKTPNNPIIFGSVLLLSGLFLGWLLFSGSGDGTREADSMDRNELAEHVQENHTNSDGETVWTCSMHPQIREQEPGNCPICGMELIPAQSGNTEADEETYSMVMTASAARLADIQTTPVLRDVPRKQVDLPGRVRVDERRITRVTTHFPGRIRELTVGFTGATIQKGEPMATIYSPELIAAQRELLEAARSKDRNPRLYESARQKFRLWEFTEEQIQTIEDRGSVQNELEILSPADGYVLSRNVAEEQHVTEGTVIFEVANLDRVWVMLEAYEEDLSWIERGDELTFRTRSHPGHPIHASVDWIDPVVNPQTRTVGVRADVENPDHRLKPDMLVHGTLKAELASDALLVPASAVLWTGPRSLVYVKESTSDVPRYRVREVVLGPRAGDFYIIKEGVTEGEEVVFHGAFRIDSEMQLADRYSMMNRNPGTGNAQIHNHGESGMDSAETREHDQLERGGDTAHPVSPLEGTTDDFREDASVLIDHYLDGKEALFNTDVAEADRAFRQAQQALDAIGPHRMSGEAHMKWMETYREIEEALNQILASADLRMKRESFKQLSQGLINVVNTFQIPGVVYQQYCPMEDAHWLSRTEKIQNPLAPETMPSCGEVIERLTY